MNKSDNTGLTISNKLTPGPGFMNLSNFDDAMKWATMICQSDFCPTSFKNKPSEVLLAIQYGKEIGLQPLQSLQGVCVIRGKPSVWGDTLLAICKASGQMEWIKEYINKEGNSLVAYCEVKRKGEPVHIEKFSQEQAIKANLWNKDIWKLYPERMLKMRARSFALRDKFSDFLKGFISVEEAEDYQVIEPKEAANTKIIKNDTILIEDQKNHGSNIDRLKKLIHNLSIDGSIVDKWLAKANVKSIDNLPESIVEVLIEFLNKKAA